MVNAGPVALPHIAPGERAELYLKFADRGTKVSFDKVPDLTAVEFLRYGEYFPD